jgi:hypothetical protein
MNASQPDILVFGRENQSIAVVEVKNLHRLSPSQAIDVRRMLFDYGTVRAPDSYHLVVSQDAAYLWQPGRGAAADADVQFDMGPVLREYLTDRDLGQRLRGAELELAIIQWLSDLARGRGKLPSDHRVVSELAKDIRGGRVEAGALA